MADSIRIYVASLSDYNAGNLYGEWIDAEQDADAIHADIAEMLRGSKYPNVTVEDPDTGEQVPSAEEWAIHDYEGFGTIKLSEHENIETVAELAAAISEHDGAFAAWYSNENRDSVDIDAFQEAYQGEFDSVTDWAEEFCDDCGMFSMVPENLKCYIDYERYGRDCELGGDIWSEDSGKGTVYIFNNN